MTHNGNGSAKRDATRVVCDMLHWDPFREIAPLPTIEMAAFSPSFEVIETKDAFVFHADVPGIQKADIAITATGNRLRISGKREAPNGGKHDTVYTYERRYGSFCRTFTLPDGVDFDRAKSELKDGVLTLAIPKRPGTQLRKIAIATVDKP